LITTGRGVATGAGSDGSTALGAGSGSGSGAGGASSAGSAANAILDAVRSIIEPTPAGDWHSACICSDGSYGVEQGLISSFPIRSNGKKLEIVPGLPINAFSRAKIDASVNELKEEKAMVAELLP